MCVHFFFCYAQCSYAHVDIQIFGASFSGDRNYSPMLNMAIPVPDFDMMSTDPSKALGSSMCSLFSFKRAEAVFFHRQTCLSLA
jgi:hypothetical protein